MGNFSLIALDMDGTLFNSRLELTEGTREAVRRAHRAGKHVVLSTGRCLSEIVDTLEALPEIRYMVCENGSCVYDAKRDRTLYAAPVSPGDILRILDMVKDVDAVLQVFHNNRSYFNQPNGEWTEDFAVGVYREIFDRTAVWDEHLFEHYADRPFQVEKFNIYMRDAQTRSRVHAMLEELPLCLADSMGYMLEVVSPQADKAIGLEKLCEYLQIPMKETIAVGDSMNDIGVLRAAGFSAAMGNACLEAKAAADYVTADCDHDGVAEVIDRFLLA